MTSHPAFELRIALKTSARAAMMKGASDEQIENLVALARGSNDYNFGAPGLLTRMDAERIIDSMMANGADPDYRKSEEELAAEREAAASAIRTAAAQKIAKKQDKENKAARDEVQAAADRKIEGRRVTHTKFGVGTVIAEDEKTMTVMFDSQKKSLRMGREFCQEAA